MAEATIRTGNEGKLKTKIVKKIIMHLEQTECPYCNNDEKNMVLHNETDHWHRMCGKCLKHYIVDVTYL